MYKYNSIDNNSNIQCKNTVHMFSCFLCVCVCVHVKHVNKTEISEWILRLFSSRNFGVGPLSEGKRWVKEYGSSKVKKSMCIRYDYNFELETIAAGL